MFGLVLSAEELRVHCIQWWGWVFELAQDRSTIDIVQQVLVVLRLVRESSVINKDVVEPPAFPGLVRNPNGRTILSRWLNRSSA
jgi:hypothetical protein